MRPLASTAPAVLLLAAAALTANAADRPIPQDDQWSKKRFDKALAWNRSTLAGAYDRVGKKDARWDEPAHEALEAAARFFSYQVDPCVSAEQVYAPAKRAIDAGCDDPLLLYLFARSSYASNYPGARELERRYAAAAAAMERSAYPPLRRLSALKKAALDRANRKDLSAEERAGAERWLDAALALLPRSLKEDERNYETENLQFELPMEVVEGLRQLNGDYQAAFDHVDKILAKTPALKAIRLQANGDFLIRSGWEARGSGFANAVTEANGEKFQRRLQEARQVLRECWALKPGDYRTATLMLAVEKGIGGDRDEMEKWFERAMKACPANKRACQQKLDWLDPKWHGSLEEMLAFGRACRDTQNWRGGLTLLVADAHYRAALHMRGEEARRKYMHSQEVWEDIKGVHREYLRHHPHDFVERSRYAAYCYLCGRYAESHEQFRVLGDGMVSFQQWPAEWMRQVRAYVAQEAAKAGAAK